MSRRERWDALARRFFALQTRERGLVAFTLVVSIVLLGWQFWVAPPLQRADKTQAQTEILLREARELEAQLLVLRSATAKDPNAPLRQQRTRLQDRLNGLQTRTETLAGGLVNPEAMVDLLRRMLTKHQALTLQGLRHDPATAIAVPADDTDSGPRPDRDQKTDNTGLYRHGITVTVTGGYLALLDYLRELEALDDRLVWRALDYKVQEWPVGRLQIRLETLSLNEEWLGV